MLFSFCRLLIIFCAMLLSTAQVNAQDAEVPYTFGGDTLLNDFLGSVSIGVPVNERATCDGALWDVMTDRAWMEAQREISQNQNIIKRPDSVLQLSCFNDFLGRLESYSWSNFPMEPGMSFDRVEEFLGISDTAEFWFKKGLFTLEPVIYPALELGLGIDHLRSQSRGFTLSTTLEILVLDQLDEVEDYILEANDMLDLYTCSKQRYIEDNFKQGIGGSGSLCRPMAQVWMQAKCYDFATESTVHGSQGFDGFYTLEEYKNNGDVRQYCGADAGNDGFNDDSPIDLSSVQSGVGSGSSFSFSSLFSAMAATASNFADFFVNELSNIGSGGLSDLACMVITHNGLNIPSIPMSALYPFTGVNPNWSSAYSSTQLTAGVGPAIDPYDPLLEFRDYELNSDDCGNPIRTGVLITRSNADPYINAVCTIPGCYFVPPDNISSLGECER